MGAYVNCGFQHSSLYLFFVARPILLIPAPGIVKFETTIMVTSIPEKQRSIQKYTGKWTL